MPAMVNVAALELPSPQEVPARFMVTTVPAVDPDAVHELNPLTVVTAGVAGMVKPAGKLAVTVLPAPSEPLDEVVKPTVQVVGVAPATWLEPVNDTAVTEVEAEAGAGTPNRPETTTAKTTATRAATPPRTGAPSDQAPPGRDRSARLPHCRRWREAGVPCSSGVADEGASNWP